MKLIKFSIYRIAIASVVALILFCLCLLYIKNTKNQKITCRADMMIKSTDATFNGIMDFKTGEGKGIANISGSVSSGSGKEYIVQRTIFFTLTNYGGNPIWLSNKIVVSDIENAPPELLLTTLPDFYLKPSTISDVNIFPVSKDGWLITKSSIPLLYCKNYKVNN
ncbi:hypothetical protein [Serratia quinivorans]|uniref:hypothetical protein n=1 Tax=Serratia quinivorans TaxID=137545 RepID=UPI00217C454C|nr:hypothetical protein [Serratia quinivorans]CAI1174638.1 Uncharacterised protein [Serratia quinivorans]